MGISEQNASRDVARWGSLSLFPGFAHRSQRTLGRQENSHPGGRSRRDGKTDLTYSFVMVQTTADFGVV